MRLKSKERFRNELSNRASDGPGTTRLIRPMRSVMFANARRRRSAQSRTLKLHKPGTNRNWSRAGQIIGWFRTAPRQLQKANSNPVSAASAIDIEETIAFGSYRRIVTALTLTDLHPKGHRSSRFPQMWLPSRGKASESVFSLKQLRECQHGLRSRVSRPMVISSGPWGDVL